MTDEMLDLARRNQAHAEITNVQWLRGHIEQITLPSDSVDVIISNCVINLCTDMQAYTGCIAGALTRSEFTDALAAAGLTDITITETHRVHAAAASAIVRATTPDPSRGTDGAC